MPVSTSCMWTDGPRVLNLCNSPDSRSHPTSHPPHPCCICVVKLSVWLLLNGLFRSSFEETRGDGTSFLLLEIYWVCSTLGIHPGAGNCAQIFSRLHESHLAGGPSPVCPKVDSLWCKHSVSTSPHAPFGGELCSVEVDVLSIHCFDIKDVNWKTFAKAVWRRGWYF